MSIKGLLPGPTLDLYVEKAKTDPLYGIAVALFELADAQRETALALDRIGFNDHRQPNGSTGCLEEIAMQLRVFNMSAEGDEK